MKMQDYYPERLGKMFIVHAPYIFMAVWKIVYPFIDKNTRKKVKHRHKLTRDCSSCAYWMTMSRVDKTQKSWAILAVSVSIY